MPLATKVFGSTQLYVTVRLQMAAALLDSRLLYGAEVWDDLTDPDLAALTQARARWLRAIVGDRRCSGSVQWTDEQIRICLAEGRLHLNVVVSLYRLQLDGEAPLPP